MKAQMRFQKYMCLAMIIVGAVALLYSFCYCSGALAELAKSVSPTTGRSLFKAAEGKYDTQFYKDIQGFNTMLMYFGIVMILLGVCLYITGCNSRRNYYVTNYIAIGACAGVNIILSFVAIIMNAIWEAKFLNVDFDSWQSTYQQTVERYGESSLIWKPSSSTLWFNLGYVVYGLVIIASILLILTLIWKIVLMKGEKKLLAGSALENNALEEVAV